MLCHDEILNKDANFHFIAIGGVGQSALAKILLQRGYSVSGSDVCDSKYLKELKALGAKVFIGHNEENLPPASNVVVSSAIKEDNPELKKAKNLKLNILHRSDMLQILSSDFPVFIGFAGTHGKTTTSGLASYLLTKIKASPAYAVGGIIPGLNTNADANKNSTVFAAELDESDGTILKYKPNILVVNNLEADHLDFYKNGLDDVLKTFKNLIASLSNDAKIVVNVDDIGVLTLLDKIADKNCLEKIVRFSAKSNLDKNGFVAKNINFNSNGAEFDVLQDDKILGRVETSLKGLHNVYNVLAVIAALIEAGYDFNEFHPFVKDFSGMGRRFQTVFKNKDIEIIDDYAHHPSEIKATLKAASDYKTKCGKKRIVAIFQPHRYTRLKALWNDFLNSFTDCDLLIVLDTFSAGDSFDEEYNSLNFVKNYKEANKDRNVCYTGGSINETIAAVSSRIEIDDIVLTLGAGDITKMGKLLGESYEGN